MKQTLLAVLLAWTVAATGQQTNTYQNKHGQTHLCGPFVLNDLQQEPFSGWYQENHDAFELSPKATEWAENLRGTEVDIYIGTWCGDSKRWMPRFVSLWEQLGLDTSQLHFIALYNGERYKQGPNHEEAGKFIHRVPTFIFKQEGKEYARIVESPQNDLETDVAQIAFGYPSQPNYRAANYVMELLQTKTSAEIEADYKQYLHATFRLAGKNHELNSLGYLYLRHGKVQEALMAFRLNMDIFPYDPNTYDSYAEALAASGDIEKSILYYQKVLEKDPGNENATAQIAALRDKG